MPEVMTLALASSFPAWEAGTSGSGWRGDRVIGTVAPLISRRSTDAPCAARDVGSSARPATRSAGGVQATASLVHVLLLTCARVLEPDLRHALRQSSQGGDALQVLAVGVRVDLRSQECHTRDTWEKSRRTKVSRTGDRFRESGFRSQDCL